MHPQPQKENLTWPGHFSLRLPWQPSFLFTAALAAIFATGTLAHDSTGGKVTMVYASRCPTCRGKASEACRSSMDPAASLKNTLIQLRHLSMRPFCDRSGGAIRSQVNDGPVKVYSAGESFSELPSVVDLKFLSFPWHPRSGTSNP